MLGMISLLWIILQVIIEQPLQWFMLFMWGLDYIDVFLGVVEWIGNDNDQDGRSDDSVNVFSCSSPSDTDEYVYSWESDQCDADGEFGRRLNQMVPIPVNTLHNLLCLN